MEALDHNLTHYPSANINVDSVECSVVKHRNHTLEIKIKPKVLDLTISDLSSFMAQEGQKRFEFVIERFHSETPCHHNNNKTIGPLCRPSG